MDNEPTNNGPQQPEVPQVDAVPQQSETPLVDAARQQPEAPQADAVPKPSEPAQEQPAENAPQINAPRQPYAHPNSGQPQHYAQPPYQNPGYPQQNYAQPPYQAPGYPQQNYAQPPYQNPGYPQQNYAQPPYQAPGYPQQNYAQPPYQAPGYPQQNYAQPPYQAPGQPQQNYAQPPYQNPGQPQQNYAQPPYQAPGYPQQNYAQPPYQAPGYPQQNYAQPPYQAPGYPQQSYTQPVPMPPEMLAELQAKSERFHLRHAGNSAALMPIFVLLFQVVLAGIAGMVWAFSNMGDIMRLAGNTRDYSELQRTIIQKFTGSMGSFLTAVIILTIVGEMLAILLGKPVLKQKVFGGWKRPQWALPDFLKWLLLTAGAVGAGEFIVMGLQALFGLWGGSLGTPDFDPAKYGASGSVVMLAYVCVIGPILEETLFRGMILPSLRPWGDWFAIVVSALLFSLTHMNLGQGISAMLIGIVFGYIAVKSGSVFPSMILHILNNTVAMVLTVNHFDSNKTSITVYIAVLIAAIIGTALLVIFRRVDFGEVASHPASAPPKEHRYQIAILQSAAFWVLAVFFAGYSIWAAMPHPNLHP